MPPPRGICVCLHAAAAFAGLSEEVEQTSSAAGDSHPVLTPPSALSFAVTQQQLVFSFSTICPSSHSASATSRTALPVGAALKSPPRWFWQRLPAPSGSKHSGVTRRNRLSLSSQSSVKSSGTSWSLPASLFRPSDGQFALHSLSVLEGHCTPVSSQRLAFSVPLSLKGEVRKDTLSVEGASSGDMLHGSGPSSSPNAIRSSAFPNAPFNSSEHTTPRCRKARHVGGTCCASKTMSHSRRSSLEREEAFCGVEKMSADTYFGVDRPESTRSRVSSPRPGQFPTSNSSSSIASLSRIRQKSPAVISTPFRQPVGDTAGRQTFTFSPLKSHSVRQTEAARGTPSPSDVGRSFASQRERGRGSNVGRNEGLLAAVPRVPPSPGGPCNLFASHRQSVQQSFAVSRDTGLCSSTRHATRSPYSFVTSHQTASSSVSCSRTVALSSLFSRPVVLSCSSRALSGISTSRHPLASSASSSFSKGPSSLASEHEEDVLLPVPCSLSQPQETGPQSPDGLRDAHRGSRLCVSVPFTCTSPPCRPSSSPVSFSLSRPRKSRAPSSSPSRVMSASLQSLARAPPPLATTRAARSIIVSSPQTASKSCAFSEARGPGSPRQSAKGGARAPFTSDAVHRASDSRGHCTVQPASGPPAPAVGGSASSSFSSSSGSLPSGTVEKGRDSVACMSKQVGTTREREVVRIKSETHDRESVGERWRGGRAGRGDSMLAEERELYPQGPLDTQWRHGGESTRRRERINQSGSELEPGHGGVACTRRWHGGDFLGTRGDSPDLPRLVGRRVSQRETAAAAVAAAAVEGRGDTGRGPDSEVFLGQRSTFSGERLSRSGFEVYFLTELRNYRSPVKCSSFCYLFSLAVELVAKELSCTPVEAVWR